MQPSLQEAQYVYKVILNDFLPFKTDLNYNSVKFW